MREKSRKFGSAAVDLVEVGDDPSLWHFPQGTPYSDVDVYFGVHFWRATFISWYESSMYLLRSNTFVPCCSTCVSSSQFLRVSASVLRSSLNIWWESMPAKSFCVILF